MSSRLLTIPSGRSAPGLLRIAAWSLRSMASLGAALWAVAANAVIIDSGDGAGNTTAPSDDPGWEYVALRAGLSAVYLGDGWMLTANHVPSGPVVLGGETYEALSGTEVRIGNGDGTFADLKLFAIRPIPDLPLLPIRSSPLPVGTPVIAAGQGRDRGPGTSWDPIGPPPRPIAGYEWAATRRLRWGTNEVDGYPDLDPFDTVAFFTRFDSGEAGDESQAANGDSGGEVFAHNGIEWELAGVLFAIGQFEEQPVETALYGNLSYAADLSFYRDEILDSIALPEAEQLPSLLVSVSFLAIAGRRRMQARRGCGAL